MQVVSRCLGREPPNRISGGGETWNCWRSRHTTAGPASGSSLDPEPKRTKTTSVTDNENLADRMAKTDMVICDPSYADPAETKAIDKVDSHTNIPEAPVSYLSNEDGKLIDTGQIIIAQELQEFKNDIYVTMVSWGHCVTSKDKYATFVSTVTVTAVTYLGFEYRSVHDGDRRGFTMKPTAKYVDECLSSEASLCCLGHGDILVMDCQCQDEFLHCTDPGLEQEWINITSLWIRQHVASCPFLKTGVACCLPNVCAGFIRFCYGVCGAYQGQYICPAMSLS